MRFIALILALLAFSPVQAQTIFGGGGGSTSPGGSNTQIQFNNSGAFGGSANFTWDGTTAALGTSSVLGWSTDLKLQRDAANTLALRNSTTAQTFNVYKTYTDASNYENLAFSTFGGNTWFIATGTAGTGTSRPLTIGTSGAAALALRTNGSDRWQVDSSGHFLAGTDNTYDIGASGATRPRTGYFGTSVITPLLTSTGLVHAFSGTAIPAGGTAGSGFRLSSTSNFGIFFGSSAPTLSAAKGSLYLRSDGTGAADRAYINTDGGTTWTAIATAG